MAKKNISILGSTGSIGVNTLKICDNLKKEFKVSYISGYNNYRLLVSQAKLYKPEFVVASDEYYSKVSSSLKNEKITVLSGDEGLKQACQDEKVDVVVNAIVGSFGLKPTVYAAEKGKKICLANKESLVMAGSVIKKMMKKTGSTLVPIDSEHSAMLQALNGEERSSLEKIILTASGGPFRDYKGSLRNVTLKEALNHPNWSMGDKITIDSATLMNKGFELIEAVHLFDIAPDKIEVVIHPESIIHSMMQFTDGSVIAQLGLPDMMIPIQYALTYPNRSYLDLPRIDFAKIAKLSFFKPDVKKFPALGLAVQAAKEGGTLPVVLNTVNEIMVYKFLDGKIKFTDIIKSVEKEMGRHSNNMRPTIEEIFEISDDLWKTLN
ncbi:MAG: 1-deoxy-D-xylulose-5-phosphate reductoisomerase [Candidatus Delongbacteria bacterium]|nr:1-deoxy-D-xylulose-5-phosphate reductoisomerase [Candidatus Delongbacteria bacterium]